MARRRVGVRDIVRKPSTFGCRGRHPAPCLKETSFLSMENPLETDGKTGLKFSYKKPDTATRRALSKSVDLVFKRHVLIRCRALPVRRS